MEMKKVNRIALSMLTAAALLAGCSTDMQIPTVDQISSASKAVGTAAGMVANSSKIEPAHRDVIREIVAEAQKCVPATNQTFAQAWTPIALEKTAKLTSAKKLTQAQADVVIAAFTVVVDGIDYLFSVKYPAAKAQLELVSAAADSFCTGFMSTFSGAAVLMAAPAKPAYDEAAYKWLSAKHAETSAAGK